MELRHLRYFLAVAEELHFRRAAERLHMSQPPLSQQVRQLEEELGVTLLERDRRGVKLTDAGTAFRDEARAILLHVDSAVDQVRRVAHGEVGRIRVGFVGTAMYGPVPELLRRFREERPGIELRLREMATSAQLEALRGGRIDVGFVRPPRAALEGGVRTAVIHREPVVAVVPVSHALASRKRLELTELRDEAFVLLARSGAPGLFDAVTLAMAQVGAVPRVVQEVAEVQTAIGLAAAGIGLTLVPASVGALVRGAAVAIPIAAPVPEVELHVAIGPGNTSPVVQALLATAGVDLASS